MYKDYWGKKIKAEVSFLEEFPISQKKNVITGQINSTNDTEKTVIAYNRPDGALIGSTTIHLEDGNRFELFMPYRPDESITLMCRDEGGDFNADIYDRISICTGTYEYNDIMQFLVMENEPDIRDEIFYVYDKNINSISQDVIRTNYGEGFSKIVAHESGVKIYDDLGVETDLPIGSFSSDSSGWFYDGKRSSINGKISGSIQNPDIFNDGTQKFSLDFNGNDINGVTGGSVQMCPNDKWGFLDGHKTLFFDANVIEQRVMLTGSFERQKSYTFSFAIYPIQTVYGTNYMSQIYNEGGIKITINNAHTNVAFHTASASTAWNTAKIWTVPDFTEKIKHFVVVYNETADTVVLYVDGVKHATIFTGVPKINISSIPSNVIYINSEPGYMESMQKSFKFKCFERISTDQDALDLYDDAINNTAPQEAYLSETYAINVKDKSFQTSGSSGSKFNTISSINFNNTIADSGMFLEIVKNGITFSKDGIHFDGITGEIHRGPSCNDTSGLYSPLVESNISVSCNFIPERTGQSEVLWKSGDGVNGIALGIVGGQIGVFACTNSVQTSITMPVSFMEVEKEHFLAYINGEVLLFVDGTLVNRISGTLTPGDSTVHDSIGAACVGSALIAGSNTTGEYFKGTVKNITTVDIGTEKLETNALLKIASDVELSGVHNRVVVTKADMLNREYVAWITVPFISATQDTIVTLLIDTKNGDNDQHVNFSETDPALPVGASPEWISLRNAAELDTVLEFKKGLFFDVKELPNWDGRQKLKIDIDPYTTNEVNIPYKIRIDSSMGKTGFLSGTRIISNLFSPPDISYTSKSVILDIADNWGNASYMGIRSIDFFLKGEKIYLSPSEFTVYGSMLSTSYNLIYIFNTSLSKIGVYADTSWLSGGVNPNINQRVIIVFNTPIEYDKIIINNNHSSGGQTNIGIRNTVITGSQDEITSTIYQDTITNGIVLYDGEIRQHILSNEADDITLFGENVIKPRRVAFENGDTKNQCYAEVFDYQYLYENIGLPLYNTTYALTTSIYNANHYAHYAFDPSLTYTGNMISDGWYSLTGNIVNQKLNVQMNKQFILSKIVLNNSHESGSTVSAGTGVRDFEVYGTNDNAAFLNIDPTNFDNLTFLGEFTARAHISEDNRDDQIFEIEDNSLSFLYYVFLMKNRIDDNHASQYMGVKRILLYENQSFIDYNVLLPSLSDTNNTVINMYYNNNNIDNIGFVDYPGTTAALEVWNHGFALAVDDDFSQTYSFNPDSATFYTIQEWNDGLIYSFKIPSGSTSADMYDFPMPVKISNSSGITNFDLSEILDEFSKEIFLNGNGLENTRLGLQYDYLGDFNIEDTSFSTNQYSIIKGTYDFDGTIERTFKSNNNHSQNKTLGEMSVSFWIYIDRDTVPVNKVCHILGTENYLDKIQFVMYNKDLRVAVGGNGTAQTDYTLTNCFMNTGWYHIVTTRGWNPLSPSSPWYTNYVNGKFWNGAAMGGWSSIQLIESRWLFGYGTRYPDRFVGKICGFKILDNFVDEKYVREVLYPDNLSIPFNDVGETIIYESDTSDGLNAMIGETLNSIEVSYINAESPSFSISFDNDTFYIFREDQWIPIASRSDSIHGAIGDSNWYYRTGVGEFILSGTNVNDAIKSSKKYLANRMNDIKIGAITPEKYLTMFDKISGILTISASFIGNKRETSCAVSKILINENDVMLSKGYDLSVVDGIIGTSQIHWLEQGFDVNFDYTNYVKVYTMITGDIQWTQCTSGSSIPGITAGMDTAGKFLKIKIVCDVSRGYPAFDYATQVNFKIVRAEVI